LIFCLLIHKCLLEKQSVAKCYKVLQRVTVEGNILQTIKRRKADWIIICGVETAFQRTMSKERWRGG